MVESEIEKVVCDYAKKLGFFVRKITFLGNTGCPDRIFIKNGKVVFVEFKRSGGKLTAKQEITINEMLKNGATVFVCDNVELGKRLLNDFV